MFSRKKNTQFSRYVDVNNDFSNKELSLSMWYLRHIFTLKKIAIGILMTWCVVTIGIGIVYWSYYLFVGYPQDQRVFAELASFPNYRAQQELYKAQPIRLSHTQVFHAGGNFYDFVSTVNNDNERYQAIVRYHYSFAGGETSQQIAAVLPGQETLLVQYGFETMKFPASISLVIDSVSWRRVNPHVLDDVQQYIDERFDFGVENFDFVRASRIEGIDGHQIRFDIVNRSAYSYHAPAFHIEFYDDGQRSGVYYIELDTLLSDDQEHIDLRSFADDLQVNSIVLY
ncbi:MAG: hypothetical protein COU30_01435, partial [Candidatus Magasanikbacteria bacterium CG10_big_fil_rev_8_21_14_0_10_38_6]